MVGPVVRDASASFDRYWDSPSAYPIMLDPGAVNPERLKRLRDRLAALRANRIQSLCEGTARRSATCASNGNWPMDGRRNYFIADDPLKISMKKRDAIARP
jgi:putative cardiolipin synthase